MLEKMQDAGCTYIYFGFEQLEGDSGKKGKPVRLAKVEQVLSWCSELGI